MCFEVSEWGLAEPCISRSHGHCVGNQGRAHTIDLGGTFVTPLYSLFITLRLCHVMGNGVRYNVFLCNPKPSDIYLRVTGAISKPEGIGWGLGCGAPEAAGSCFATPGEASQPFASTGWNPPSRPLPPGCGKESCKQGPNVDQRKGEGDRLGGWPTAGGK